MLTRLDYPTARAALQGDMATRGDYPTARIVPQGNVVIVALESTHYSTASEVYADL